MARVPAGVEKISAGHYLHITTGRHIVQTECWEGPQGGNWKRWEHAKLDDYGLCIDGWELFRTLREAVEELDAEAANNAADAGSEADGSNPEASSSAEEAGER